MPPGLDPEALRLGSVGTSSAGTGASAKAATKVPSNPIDEGQNVLGGWYGGAFNVPRGAIGVRSDYVSPVLWV